MPALRCTIVERSELMRRWLAAWALCWFFVFSIAPLAVAQHHSGGHFGGSHFHSGGGFHHSSGGFHSSGFHSSGFHSTYSHGSSGDDDVFGVFLVIGAVVAIFIRLATLSMPTSSGRPGPQARAWMSVDVSVVRIVVDATSRAFMQEELAKIAHRGTANKAQLHAALLRVVRLLRKCDAVWLMAGASNHHPMSPPIAEATFRRHTDDARAMYMHELVGSTDGRFTTRESPGFTPRASEGEGAALITLIVAARREIRDLGPASKREIHEVLFDLQQLTQNDLVALEVVWMPADPDDRMSSATIAALDPTLRTLPGARGGLVHCAFCRGPFAGELPTCPHCGAKAP
jgi:uncharacterized membrane protein